MEPPNRGKDRVEDGGAIETGLLRTLEGDEGVVARLTTILSGVAH